MFYNQQDSILCW